MGSLNPRDVAVRVELVALLVELLFELRRVVVVCNARSAQAGVDLRLAGPTSPPLLESGGSLREVGTRWVAPTRVPQPTSSDLSAETKVSGEDLSERRGDPPRPLTPST